MNRRPKIEKLLGSSIDATKLVSSMTLFAEVGRRCHAAHALDECDAVARVAEEILELARRQGHPRCAFTLAQLASRE